MGLCASSSSSSSSHSNSTTTLKTRARSIKSGAGAFESFRRPSTIMVMDMEGGIIKEYKQPIPASHVVSENPGWFLCNSESMYVGTCMPRVPDEEVLLPGRIYFLAPISESQQPLTLPLLCDLAVKAGCALSNNTKTASVQR